MHGRAASWNSISLSHSTRQSVQKGSLSIAIETTLYIIWRSTDKKLTRFIKAAPIYSSSTETHLLRRLHWVLVYNSGAER